MIKNQTPQVKLTPRDLGQILLDDFCYRCFWFTKKFPFRSKHPFSSPMPGIVSILDTYIKKSVKQWFANKKKPPEKILNQLSKFYPHLDFEDVKQVNCNRKWEVSVLNGLCTLRGFTDEVFEIENGSWFIIDYKVALLNDTQKRLVPLYEAQLNAYGYMAQKKFNKAISGLALVYFVPEYRDLDENILWNRVKEDFLLGFKLSVIPVDLKEPEWIENLCEKICKILSSDLPPKGRPNCDGCASLSEWLKKINSVNRLIL